MAKEFGRFILGRGDGDILTADGAIGGDVYQSVALRLATVVAPAAQALFPPIARNSSCGHDFDPVVKVSAVLVVMAVKRCNMGKWFQQVEHLVGVGHFVGRKIRTLGSPHTERESG